MKLKMCKNLCSIPHFSVCDDDLWSVFMCVCVYVEVCSRSGWPRGKLQHELFIKEPVMCHVTEHCCTCMYVHVASLSAFLPLSSRHNSRLQVYGIFIKLL